ncbi:SRPBCC family protein [Schlesneria sp.]|uniref:SRPBCC family protein n=1 Tax=Schlesneria sp. TaxID=2762018 RepID=UPI002EF01D03
MPIFESRTDLHGSLDQVFDFLIRPANLQAIAPPQMQFVFVTPPPIIELGSRLKVKAQVYGMVQELTYEIVELNTPTRFREKMVEGPLKLWLHDYIVEPHSSSDKVTLINRIEFEPPGGVLGFLVTADSILEALEDGFEHRREALQKQFPHPGA